MTETMRIALKRCGWDNGAALNELGVPGGARFAYFEPVAECEHTYVRVFVGESDERHPNGRLALACFIDDPEHAAAYAEVLRNAGVKIEDAR